MTDATSMRAVVLEAYDQPFHLTSVPRPSADAGQVLVRIAASGVNPLDLKIRAGQAAHARQLAAGVHHSLGGLDGPRARELGSDRARCRAAPAESARW